MALGGAPLDCHENNRILFRGGGDSPNLPYLDVLGRKLGSMVIGSMGLFHLFINDG